MSFQVPTRVVSGLGALAALPAELGRLGARRVAVVADAGVAASGLLDGVLDGVDTALLGPVIQVGPDPDVAAAEDAVERAAGCDAVLAVGGGSALGAAKAVAIRLTNPGPITRWAGVDAADARPAPTIAVPTTAGSGSEVSRVLVLHEAGRAREVVVRVEGAAPAVAILDGTVLRGLPSQPLLFAGLDALSHALEAQWVRRASWFATALARRAARTLLDALPAAVAGARDGSNAVGTHDALLQELLEASCAANMACGNSGLGLVHALSSATATGLPHGRQNGILLPGVAAFNASVLDASARALVRELPALLAEVGFTPAFPPGTAAGAMVEATRGHEFRANNLRPSRDEDLFDLLAAAGAH